MNLKLVFYTFVFGTVVASAILPSGHLSAQPSPEDMVGVQDNTSFNADGDSNSAHESLENVETAGEGKLHSSCDDGVGDSPPKCQGNISNNSMESWKKACRGFKDKDKCLDLKRLERVSVNCSSNCPRKDATIYVAQFNTSVCQWNNGTGKCSFSTRLQQLNNLMREHCERPGRPMSPPSPNDDDDDENPFT